MSDLAIRQHASTVRRGRDRRGHACALAIAIVLSAPAVALGQSQVYKAQRFDADIRVLPGGKMQVDESLVFDFQQGTFTRVWRDIPAAKTDGIQVLEATLDGESLSRGSGPGHVTVSGRGTVHVEWHLPPTGPSVHTFGLTYNVSGVGRAEGGRDLIEWQPLPSQHAYAIDSSRVVFRTPQAPVDAPSLQSRRVDTSNITIENGLVTASASGVAANGWISVGLRFPQGSVVQAQPRWLMRQQTQSEEAPRWILAAAGAFAAGLLLLLFARAGYRSPTSAPPSAETAPPGPVQPAVAAALLGRGDTRSANPIATLLALADRGVIAIHEGPRTLGVRNFILSQMTGSHELAPHEEAALRIAFADGGDDVSLSKARGRLARHGRRFASALADEMIAGGLIDPVRKAIRMRVTILGAVLLAVGAFGTIALVPLATAHGAWPLLVGAAVALSGIVGLILAVSTSALTDEGAMQASRWRGFRRHLKEVSGIKGPDVQPAPAGWAVYAAAFGLGYYWARYLRHHGGVVPSWFAAADGGDATAAYAALIGTAGAQAHGGGAAGGGSGAAGGGASGAA